MSTAAPVTRLFSGWAAVLVVAVALAGCSPAGPPSDVTADRSGTAGPTPSPSPGPGPGPDVTLPPRWQVPPPQEEPGVPVGLHSLVPGHNDLGADRVNLVFGAHAAPDPAAWQQFAHDLLTWSGPVPVTGADRPSRSLAEVVSLAWGPFALAPLASRKDLFNVWYLDQPLPDPREFNSLVQVFPVDLPDEVLVALSWDAGGGSVAETANFLPPELPPPGVAWFGTVTMALQGALEEQSLVVQSGILAHELGHALYNLPDTYVFDQTGGDTSGPVRSAYPSCAGSPEQAQEWFGDLVGTVDPFFEQWQAEYERYGIPIRAQDAAVVQDLIRVTLVPNGCFGPEGVAVRASQNGLMHSYAPPLLNAVERRWAEQVLDAWVARPAEGTVGESR